MREKIELQRMIDNAYKQVRDGNCKSKAYEIFIEHYEHLQRRHVRMFGESYVIPQEFVRQGNGTNDIDLERLEEMARTCAG